MKSFLEFFVLIPLIGFLGSLFLPRHNEGLIAKWTFTSVAVHMISFQAFLVYWILQGYDAINLKDIVLYRSDHYEFFLDFYFDKITAVYIFVGSLLTFMVTMYSRTYLHREVGYKRFFNTILLFYLGYNLAVFSGNLETLFIGWEILGISSFLLIAFYRDRYLPVKNAVKVFSIYRVADVGLILAMWMSHHLWHESITFDELSNYDLIHSNLQEHTWVGVFISLMFLLSASAKSAQLPFSSWLPRAMEGPTPSSAIFYGSLSVHLGVFIMMRTYPIWEHQTSVRVLIGLMGFTTAVITTGIARVQSSIKSQIAYSSIAQIGLIFIEIAAGFGTIALIHFAGNAFLRTYQLLVSPSVVSYLIREQFYNFLPRIRSVEDSFPQRIQYTLYMLCIKEWNLDSMMYQYLWNPIKKIGQYFTFLNLSRVFALLVPVYLVGLFCTYNKQWVLDLVEGYLPIVFSLVGVICVLKAFTERQHARVSWLLVIMNHFWIALAISFNENFTFNEIHLYLIGVAIAGLVGFAALKRLRLIEGNIDLDQFHGHSYKHPKISMVFLLACLGATGFPITPTFIGEDLIFSHIHENQWLLAFFTSLSFVVDGLAIIRIYARVFLGPHSKSVYEMAYRSS
ncbi:MAG: proton-conducting transporter membrane subunit [Cytophagales bacterium]